MLKFNLSLNFEVNIFSEENLLDALILEVKRVCRDKGIPGLVATIATQIDRALCVELRRPWGEAHQKLLINPCCRKQQFETLRQETKTLLTSLGNLPLNWTRLRCIGCGASQVPLRSAFGLKPREIGSQECLKLICETVVEQSYRRSVRHLFQIGDIGISKTKIHRWVMNSDCDVIDADVRKHDLKILIADGTGFPEFKLKKAKNSIAIGPDGIPRKSDLKVVIGMTKDFRTIPIGVWSKKSWKSVSRTIKKANHHPKLKFKPIADCLVCDGEEALVREMGKLTQHVQRCQWHLTHDFVSLMRYQESTGKEEAYNLAHELHEAMSVSPPDERTAETKLEVERDIFIAEAELTKLIQRLREKNFFQAATYVENAKRFLFTYLRLWLRDGLLPPSVSSKIERLMREFGRRIKKIGFNWSAKGAEKMARILLKIIARDGSWERYWADKLKNDGQVKIIFRGAVVTG